jgi:hypothetical protein
LAVACGTSNDRPAPLTVGGNTSGGASGAVADAGRDGASDGASNGAILVAEGVDVASVQITTGHVWWIDRGGSGRTARIQRASRPSGMPETVIDNLPGPSSLVVDASGIVYVALAGQVGRPAGIYRVEGGNLIAESAGLDDTDPDSLVLSSGNLYWLTQNAGATNLRRKPSGGPAVTIATTLSGDYGPHSIAFDGAFVYAGLSSAGGSTLVRAERTATVPSGEIVANLPVTITDVAVGAPGTVWIAAADGVQAFATGTRTLTKAYPQSRAVPVLQAFADGLFYVVDGVLLRQPVSGAMATEVALGVVDARALALANDGVYVGTTSFLGYVAF